MRKNDRNLFILVTLFVISIVIANVVGARTVTTGLRIGGVELGNSIMPQMKKLGKNRREYCVDEVHREDKLHTITV